MTRPGIQLGVLVSVLLLVLLPACAPKYEPPDEPVDTAPSGAGDAGASGSEGGGAGGEVEEVDEPWEAPPVVEEEKLTASALERRAEQFNSQEVLGDIFFPFDKDELTEEARDRLTSHARWLKANPDFGLLIEGHCDERDTEEYNLALGERRANAAREYLVLLGIDQRRLQTISYGEERPVDSGHTEAAWSKNRRGHFVVQVLEGMDNASLGG
jgi:peptidoglycan-associated lipoprotein